MPGAYILVWPTLSSANLTDREDAYRSCPLPNCLQPEPDPVCRPAV